MTLKIVCFFFLLSCFTAVTNGQAPGIDNEAAVYKMYSSQVAELLKVRGVNNDEIEEILTTYKENDISSDQKLAQLLKQLYPGNRGILVVFYYFINDTLRRVIFEPGAVKEKKYIPIKRQDLLQLSADFNHVLGLYGMADKRSPVKRGVIVQPPPASKGLTYGSLVKKATQLLLPGWFDTSWRHVIFIPALNLSTIPFHLLQPYGTSSLLLEHCSFSVAPTIGDLIALRMKALKIATRWTGKLSMPFSLDPDLKQLDSLSFSLDNPLFISNPVYPTNTAFSFPDLPGAGKEIENAIPYARKYVLLKGEEATKANVLKNIGNADVVYFATHGMADAEKPMEKSFLVLSGSDPFLTAKDIMEVRKQYKKFPEMVILSACQTGLGKSMEVGVAGLARSFMLAGSNHVIMSLWNVDDAATAYLMNRFLYHLQKPTRFMPAEPLRLALLDTKTKYPKPSQWAGFSLFGIEY